MRLFALADLHLSSSGDKPMDVFGEVWANHARRMAAAWDHLVCDDDVVLLGGDLSWARSLAEAAPDLAWIGARPGTKVLLRGNHDSWWTSISRVRRALPPRCFALQHDALDLGPWIVLGARGWIPTDDPAATPADGPVFARELERLSRSIDDARRRFPDRGPRVALLHFPPWLAGREPSPVVPLLRDAGVAHCVYGHLHGEDHALAVTGEHGGIRFHFVAADAVGFAPSLVAVSDGESPQ